MKKSNNKGFSLVELIVVIAIMAVLVGVLAPAYLKYVENSRKNKDELNAEEIRHAVEIILAEEGVYDKLAVTSDTDKTATITITDANSAAASTFTGSPANTDVIAAAKKAVGEKLDFTSKEYNGKVLEVKIDITDGVKVTKTIKAAL